MIKKFRVWDTRKNMYVPVAEIIFRNYEEPVMEVIPNCLEYVGDSVHNGEKQYDRFVVEQFIGIKDSNGKDVYEGDITHTGIITYVTDLHWDGGGSRHPGFYFEDSSGYNELSYHDDLDFTVEVIGNIHENPELLVG